MVQTHAELQETPPPSSPRTSPRGDGTGAGVVIYVLDTGIDATNSGFGGRVTYGLNNVAKEPNTDQNGHGTAVAEVIAGTHYGVATKATLISVKVLDKKGGGSLSSIVSGMTWSVADARTKSVLGKAIINLSIYAGYSASVNYAVDSAVASGLFVSAAAGDSDVRLPF